MTEIIWEDPSRASSGQKPSERRVAMTEHPGKWLLWAEGVAPSTVTRLRAAGFEATGRRHRAENGRFVCDIYARWPE